LQALINQLQCCVEMLEVSRHTSFDSHHYEAELAKKDAELRADSAQIAALTARLALLEEARVVSAAAAAQELQAQYNTGKKRHRQGCSPFISSAYCYQFHNSAGDVVTSCCMQQQDLTPSACIFLLPAVHALLCGHFQLLSMMMLAVAMGMTHFMH
jgi:hypothetical protein